MTSSQVIPLCHQTGYIPESSKATAAAEMKEAADEIKMSGMQRHRLYGGNVQLAELGLDPNGN
jgi:hypothetical protein